MDNFNFEKKFRVLYRNLYHKFESNNIAIFLNFVIENKNIIINHKYNENIINAIYKIKNMCCDIDINNLDVIFTDYYIFL